MFKKKDEGPFFVYESPLGIKDLDFLKTLDLFLEKFHRGEIAFKGAFDIRVSRNGVNTNLGKLLSWQLTNYEMLKSEPNNEVKIEIAGECLGYINHARIAGAIQETESVISKLEKSNEERELLKEQNNRLREEYDKLDKKYQHVTKDFEEYKKGTNNLFGKGGEVQR